VCGGKQSGGFGEAVFGRIVSERGGHAEDVAFIRIGDDGLKVLGNLKMDANRLFLHTLAHIERR
jgi:hypothetical protein